MMSLRGQFILSVVLALLLSLSVLGVVACWHARASVDNEMRMALEAGDRIVDNALLSLPRQDQDPYLERLVRSFDDNRHVRVALIEGGREIAASRLARPDNVPGWYRRLLQIPTEQRIDTAPRLMGRTLRVATDASPSTAPSPTFTPGPTHARAQIHAYGPISISYESSGNAASSKSCVAPQT